MSSSGAVVGLAFDDGARNKGLVDGMAGKIGLRLAGAGVRVASAAGGGNTCLLLAGGAGKGSRPVDFLLIATMFLQNLWRCWMKLAGKMIRLQVASFLKSLSQVPTFLT